MRSGLGGKWRKELRGAPWKSGGSPLRGELQDPARVRAARPAGRRGGAASEPIKLGGTQATGQAERANRQRAGAREASRGGAATAGGRATRVLRGRRTAERSAMRIADRGREEGEAFERAHGICGGRHGILPAFCHFCMRPIRQALMSPAH